MAERLDPRVLDALAAALLLVAALALPGAGPQLAASSRGWDVPGSVLLAAQALPLAVRRLTPATTLLACTVATGAFELAGYPATLAAYALPLAVLSGGLHVARERASVGALSAAGVVAAAAWLVADGRAGGASVLVAYGLLLLGCWTAGTRSRSYRQERADRETRAVTAARGQERARLARELHDVVTHHVTAMVIQADAARYVDEEVPTTVAGPLRAISETGRRALVDLRLHLDVLGDEPAAAAREPLVAELGALVARAIDAGQSVTLAQEGEGEELTGTVRLAVYRVVQEALTNAMKHAPGGHSEVAIDYAEEVTVRVRTRYGDVPAGPVAVGRTGSGRGLRGLRARVEALHGRLDAGDRGDGFLVEARIPARTVAA